MKICYIGDGDSVHNHFMVDWFCNRGHELLFLTDTPENAPNCETIPVAKRTGFSPLRHWKATRKVRKIVKQWQPHILHAHNVTGYGYWGAGAKYKPLIMTAWGSDLNVLAHKNMAVYKMVCNALKAADFITADAEALCDTVREMAGADRDVRLLQWGVELPEFEVEVPAETQQHYRGEAEFVFISTRRLRKNYNVDVILNAYSKVIASHPKTRLIVVGDDNQKPELEAWVKKQGLKDRVLFTGWLERQQLIYAVKSADCFISVPDSDSTALSMLEAFAARLPVIVSNLAANTEWIENGENGYLVRGGDVIQLTQAMNRICDNQEQVKQWGIDNYKLVQERGNREIEMQNLENWYKELAKKYFGK